MKDKVDKNWF